MSLQQKLKIIKTIGLRTLIRPLPVQVSLGDDKLIVEIKNLISEDDMDSFVHYKVVCGLTEK